MPYKTEHGSHYHETWGCHGATIPCGTEGLTPCSDCCGTTTDAGGKSGDGSAGVLVGPGSTATNENDFPVIQHAYDAKHDAVMRSVVLPGERWLASDEMPAGKADNQVVAKSPIPPSPEPFVNNTGKPVMQTMYNPELGATVSAVVLPGEKGLSMPGYFPKEERVITASTEAVPKSPDTGSTTIDDQSLIDRLDIDSKDEATTAAEEERQYEAFTRQQEMKPSAPDPLPEQILASPAEVKRAVANLEPVMRFGSLVPHRLPSIRAIGNDVATRLGGFAMSVRRRWQKARSRRQLNAIRRRTGCNDWVAMCVQSVQEGQRLARTRASAEQAIRQQLVWDAAGGKRTTRDDVICNYIEQVAERVRRRWGVMSPEALDAEGYLAFVNETRRAIEESGYGDKVTESTLEVMRRRLGDATGAPNVITEAMRTVRDDEMFRRNSAMATMKRMVGAGRI